MRIAMLGVKTLPSASGVEKVVEEVGSRLVARGHEVTVYTREHFAGAGESEYRGIQVRPTWSIMTKHLDALTHSLAAAVAINNQTDILHVHTTNFAPAIAISKFRGIPVVVQSHGLDWRRAKWGIGASAYLWASDVSSRRWSDSLVVVSRTLEQAYKTRAGRKPIYVPNGVAPWPRESLDLLAPFGLRGRRYVLFAARLVPEKGCHYLLDAFRKMQPPDVDLVIAGDDLYNSAYAKGLKEQAGPGVHFLGAVLGAQFRALVQHADVFVLPSELEGLSTGLLEAMSARRCIVASALPENLEAVGDTALTFPAGDIRQLANALSTAITDGSLRERCGAAAAERVSRLYDWDRSTELLENVYQNVIRSRHRPRQEQCNCG
jgi:glycosyltransferase involved in cell wall biosynthesis